MNNQSEEVEDWRCDIGFGAEYVFNEEKVDEDSKGEAICSELWNSNPSSKKVPNTEKSSS